MDLLNTNFVIRLYNKEEWEQTKLILSFYGLITTHSYNDFNKGYHYMRYQQDNNKYLICGSYEEGFKEACVNHKLITFKELIENY